MTAAWWDMAPLRRLWKSMTHLVGVRLCCFPADSAPVKRPLTKMSVGQMAEGTAGAGRPLACSEEKS